MEWRLLKSLSDEEIRRVLTSSRRRRFDKGEVLFHEGDPAAHLHLVVKGRIAIRVQTPLGDVATLEVLGPGDTLGELALISSTAVRNATAIALEPTETMSMEGAAFRALRRADPAVTDVLLEVLAERVRQLDARLIEALFVTADVRVLRRLLELSEMYGATIPLTQEDLAGLAGTTRATVNRVLRREVRSGALSLARGRVMIVDPQALAGRAGVAAHPTQQHAEGPRPGTSASRRRAQTSAT